MALLAGQAGDIWGEDDNPRRYEAYAREYPGYRETSQDLVAVALPPAGGGEGDAAAVVDLACGTGAATREVLARLGPDGTVVGVDRSAAMLAAAAAAVTDPRVSWINAPAEGFHQHVSEPADAVICNAAIWQTDIAATAKAARAALRQGGRFAFNVPLHLLDSDSHERRERYPALIREMQAIAERDYGWTPPGAEVPGTMAPDQRPGAVRPHLTRETIGSRLAAAGLEIDQVIDISYPDSTEAARAWLAIPIFTTELLAGLPYSDRSRILDAACERIGPGPAELAEWVIFVARA